MNASIFPYLYICLSLFWGSVVYSQDFLCTRPTIDFGKIAYTDTLVVNYLISNKGDKDLIIQKIESDCSCVESQSLPVIISSGKSHTLDILFLPYRAGSFKKEIKLHTNESASSIHPLSFQGFLRPPYQWEKLYPFEKGPLYTESRILNFGHINTANSVSRKLLLFNPGPESVEFSSDIIAPPHIKVQFDSTHIIGAEQTESIVFTYDPAAKNDYSYVTDTVKMRLIKPDTSVIFTIAATIEPYYPPYSLDELAQKPQIWLSREDIDLGSRYLKDSLIVSVEMKNIGGSPLKVLKWATSFGLSILNPSIFDSPLNPGDSVEIQILFEDTDRKGSQSRNLTILCDDPKNYTKSVVIKANVK